MKIEYRLLIDFGSTFTKIVAFDMEREELAARVQTPSTVDIDITKGLLTAISMLKEKIPISEKDIKQAIACSSAAGGLRMICIGLVPEYTTEAGKLAALGAGAKVVGTYSYELSRSETDEIAKIAPDIILLTGGTDGGNKNTICHNAMMLAEIGSSIKNIIVAGNKSASDEIKSILADTGISVMFAKNVMPEFGVLDLDPVNEVIREIFINHITEAKGIAQAREMIGDIIMPTPSAVLEAAKLISSGTREEPGLGELLLVDVGGATTDVYSIASGNPTKSGVSMIGLPEPYAKRTVEGDLGLYHNLETLEELDDAFKHAHATLERTSAISENPNITSENPNAIPELSDAELSSVQSTNPVIALKASRGVPEGDEQINKHLLLSKRAVAIAVERHCGKLERRITHNGEIWLQRGKDLTNIGVVLGAGGPVAFSVNPRFVLEGASMGLDVSLSLKPRSPSYMLDSKYILFAIGLLSLTDPVRALRIAKKYLSKI